jgi:hypothetical protein
MVDTNIGPYITDAAGFTTISEVEKIGNIDVFL